jgi:ATP-dependent helicase/DNAse subunit B
MAAQIFDEDSSLSLNFLGNTEKALLIGEIIKKTTYLKLYKN